MAKEHPGLTALRTFMITVAVYMGKAELPEWEIVVEETSLGRAR